MPVALQPHVQEALDKWMGALESRHLQDLSFQEVTRALRALSSCYVERRHRLASGNALEGRGKRAAFALFYAPIHLILTAHVVQALEIHGASGDTIVDVGCGTGAAGGAWALAGGSPVDVLGIDRSVWAAREAEWNWRTLGVRGRALHGDVARLRWPRGACSCVAAFTVNELPSATRDGLRSKLLAMVRKGDTVLVIEPVAGAVTPWWDEWTRAFADVGGEERRWRAALPLPELVRRLDRAAGLDHRELTARSIHAVRRP
jgi:SAM-dependent methyltransferase